MNVVLMFSSSFFSFLVAQGEYSGLSNVEKCKMHRSKGSEQNKKNVILRKKLWHGKLNENPTKYEQYKVN